MDAYLAHNPWHRPGREPVLLDLGCGFPPVTALDSATTLPGWRVIGDDPSFDRYFVYDGADYACFDVEGLLRFFPDRHHGGRSGPDAMAHRGARLVLNPLRHYERDNLRLTHGEIGSVDIEGGVDVIRCMNVLMYFDHAFENVHSCGPPVYCAPAVYSFAEITGVFDQLTLHRLPGTRRAARTQGVRLQHRQYPPRCHHSVVCTSRR